MPFAIALIVSAALHAAAISLPGWNLPGEAEPEPPAIEAHLAPPPQPQPAEPRRPKAKPASRHQAPAAEALPSAAPVASAPTTAAEAAPQPPAVSDAPGAEAVAPAPPAPPAPPWGGKSRVRFAVTYGEGGFVIGEAIQEWQAEAGHYKLSSAFEPRGLAALSGRTRTQVSEGEIAADGLRPGNFRDQREGREAETATFDWAAGKVAFSGGRGEAMLPAGAEDLLSVFYQLAWLAPRRNVTMNVATGSRLGRWTFDYLGEETLALPTGPTPALHLRTQADGDTTEVWLATARGGLPLKIRHTDRKGGVFEQVVSDMEGN